MCWNNNKNPLTIKEALFFTSPTQQTSGHKEAKGPSGAGTLGDNLSDLQMKNGHGGEEIFKCHNCKLDDGALLLSDRNAAPECITTSDLQSLHFLSSGDGTGWIRKVADILRVLST